MVTQDRDEELALFLELRRREKEQGASPLTGSENGSNGGTGLSTASKTLSSLHYPLRRTAAENFLYSENEKSDYEWLLTPPGTPQFEKESHRTLMRQLDVTNARPTILKSGLGNSQEDSMSRSNESTKHHPMLSPGLNSSIISGIRRPSSSGGLRSSSRPSTPTGRSTIPATATKASSSRSSTPTSRATLASARPTGPARSSTPTRSTARSSTPTARPSLPATKSLSRSTTPTARPSLPATKSLSRSTTPTARPSLPATKSLSRSTTPTARPSLPATKSSSRPATPTRRPSTLTGPLATSAKTTAVQKPSPTDSKPVNKQVPSLGTSPTVKSRPWKPSEMPGFSLEAPPNLRTTLPDRPLSASRGRPGAPSSRSVSLERSSGNERARRQSCSPSRGRAPIGNSNGNLASFSSLRGRAKPNNGDSVSPVVIGNKMVERVVNMRKLGPPRQTENNYAGKSSLSVDSSGYGRSLSKSSLDMALRHMDIKRGITGNLRPLVTKVPASSMYSVRSTASTRSRPPSVSGSPLATSSNTSSEPSVNNVNILCLDGSEAEDNDLLSEKGNSSPRSQLER